MRRVPNKSVDQASTSLWSIALLLVFVGVARSALPYTGINFTAAEWSDGPYWPNPFEIDYFVSRGMNVFRFPFKWEKLQPTLRSAFDSSFWQGYLAVVDYIVNVKGQTVVIDPHNYARYNNIVIDTTATFTTADLMDLWTRLASEPLLKSNDKVIFGIMNEPYGMSTVAWANAANQSIAAIRATGATNRIFVPGNGFTGSSGWTGSWYDTAKPQVSNADALKNIYDPLNHYSFEVHTYFDKDRGGGVPECEAGPVTPSRFQSVTDWMRANNRTVFLGEFGGGYYVQNCLDAFKETLEFLQANSDVWIGWTFWAAGPRFASAFLSGEPIGYPPQTNPSIDVIMDYVHNPILAKTYPDITPASYGCTPGDSMLIYDDALVNGWVSRSWGTYSYSNPNAYNGTYSMSFTPKAWTSLYLQSATPVPLTRFNAVEFYVSGDAPGNQIIEFSVSMQSGIPGASQPLRAFLPSGNITSTWSKGVIPFSILGNYSMSEAITFVGFADASGLASQPTIYLDKVKLVCTSITGGTLSGITIPPASDEPPSGAPSSGNTPSGNNAPTSTVPSTTLNPLGNVSSASAMTAYGIAVIIVSLLF